MAQQPIIGLYETVSALSERMLLAARAGDWDLMDALERECAGQVALIVGGRPAAPLSWDERTRKVRMVQRILACDREIRHLLEPWMADLALRINSPGSVSRLFARA